MPNNTENKSIPLPPDHDEANSEPELTDVFIDPDNREEGEALYRERVKDREIGKD